MEEEIDNPSTMAEMNLSMGLFDSFDEEPSSLMADDTFYLGNNDVLYDDDIFNNDKVLGSKAPRDNDTNAVSALNMIGKNYPSTPINLKVSSTKFMESAISSTPMNFDTLQDDLDALLEMENELETEGYNLENANISSDKTTIVSSIVNNNEQLSYQSLSSNKFPDLKTPSKKPKRNRLYVNLEFKDYTKLPTNTIRYQVATTDSGDNLYFPLRQNRDVDVNSRESYHSLLQNLSEDKSRTNINGLLNEPIHKMIDKAKSLIQAEKNALKSINKEKNNMNLEEVSDKGKSIASKTVDELWVNKFKPQKYIDLIGNERHNRHILHWLKLWDRTVFNKKSIIKENEPFNKYENNNHSFGENKFKNYNNKYPEKTILMISGPPGLGKTTLAHIIAEHCGYFVQEMNASDDRTGSQANVDKLEGALLTQNVATSKPTCLIIDEIDGADSSFIRALLKLTQPHKQADRTDDSKTSKPTKKYSTEPLSKRPVICICNDFYASSLRPMRNLVESVKITTADNLNTVTRRLMEICEQENINLGIQTINELVSDSGGDIRSCINTLQFLSRKMEEINEVSKEINDKPKTIKELLDSGELIIPYKDRNKNLWDTLRNIFIIPTSKQAARNRASKNEQRQRLLEKSSKSVGSGIISGGKQSSGGVSKDTLSATEFIMEEIRLCDDIDILVQACFEHYLQSWIFDTSRTWPEGKPTFDIYGNSTRPKTKIESSLDWLMFYDRMENVMNKYMDFRLFRYLGYTIVKMHTSFASVGKMNVWFPRLIAEIKNQNRMSNDLISRLRDSMEISVRPKYSSIWTIRKDFIPYIPFIISPDMKLANIHILSSSEKKTLTRVIDVMVSLGLKFVPKDGIKKDLRKSLKESTQVDRDDYGNLILEPDVVGFLRTLNDKNLQPILVGKKLLSGNQDIMKQHINTWIVRENIIRKNKIELNNITKEDSKNKLIKSGNENKENKHKRPKIQLNLEVSESVIKKKKKIARDFFGREIIVKEEITPVSENILDDSIDNKIKTVITTPSINYVYHEGFSNAVRKPFYIKDLFI